MDGDFLVPSRLSPVDKSADARLSFFRNASSIFFSLSKASPLRPSKHQSQFHFSEDTMDAMAPKKIGRAERPSLR